MARKSDTKEKLINTASELIWKHNYSSVSVDDICKAAQVNKGSFYYFFKSKSDLAVASIEEHFENAKVNYEKAFSSAYTPVQRFENIIDYIIKTQTDAAAKFGQVCGCPYATLGSEVAGQDDQIRLKAESILKRYEKYYVITLSDMVATGQLPEQTNIEALAAEMQSYVVGQVFMARIHNSLEVLKRDLKKGLLRMLDTESQEVNTVT
jgi:TetR/AcrR family transcriptional repressor of nem operon